MTRWLVFVSISTVMAAIVLAMMIYTFEQCGIRALLLGDKAFIAAITGICN
jgi:hypothetical protein